MLFPQSCNPVLAASCSRSSCKSGDELRNFPPSRQRKLEAAAAVEFFGTDRMPAGMSSLPYLDCSDHCRVRCHQGERSYLGRFG